MTKSTPKSKESGSSQANKAKVVKRVPKAAKGEKLLKSGVPASVGKATQFKPGQSGNPAGPKPGFKHLSTHIQELLNDEKFETQIQRGDYKIEDWKGAPIKAILRALAVKAMHGDTKAFDALAKYGYGTKVEVTGAGGEALIPVVRIIDERRAT